MGGVYNFVPQITGFSLKKEHLSHMSQPLKIISYESLTSCPEIAGHGRQFSVIFPYTKSRAFYRALMEF